LETSNDTQTYKHPLADIGAMITASMSQSVAAAEFRALDYVDLDNWSVADLIALFGARGIGVEKLKWIEIKKALSRDGSNESLYIALNEEDVIVFSHDESRSAFVGKSLSEGTARDSSELIQLFDESYNEWLFLKCAKRVTEKLAIVPGVEKHWFWSTIWTNRSLYLQSGLAALLTNVFALGVSLFSMIVYNRIIPSNAMNSLLVLVSGLVILMLVDYVVKNIRNRFLSVAGVSSDLTLADRLFGQVMDLQYKSRSGTVGSLANTLKEFEHIREFFASATLTSMIDVPFATIFLLTIWLVGGWMVIPVGIGIAILLLTTFYLQPKMKALAQSSFEDGQTKHSVMVESLTGLETLKLLGAGGFMRRRLRDVLERQADISEQTKAGTHFSTNIAQTVQQLVQMSVVAFGAILVSQGEFGFGAIIACTILSGKALAPFAQLSQLLVRLNQIGVSYKALAELMGQPIEHPQDHSFLPRNGFKGSIEFKNVTFTYPGQQEPVLDDVSFKINAEENVAILGHVGSGKTTIGRLVAGLYEPDAGVILIDGIDIRQIAPSDLRESIGFSAQDTWLMSTTIEQNISLGAITADPETILWAGDISGVSEFANRHPDGYKLVLKERGESLSGGQRQAIALARALARKPSMIILDEPTSSMDARSEQTFVNKFKDSKLSATLLLITHRTSLLSLVDRVIVMEHGRVAGMGTTDQFVKAQSDKNVAAQIVRNASAAQFGIVAGKKATPAPKNENQAAQTGTKNLMS
jgi:ATP-binding cassette subfamily C protein LapB